MFWRYHNTTLLILSLLVLYLVKDTKPVIDIILHIERTGLWGALGAGFLFTSTFTTGPAILLISRMGTVIDPLTLALIGGIGAMCGDYILLHILQDRVFEELAPLFKKMKRKRHLHIFDTPYFAWLAPLAGALIIASPIPDEAGIGLLGTTKISHTQFLILTFMMNALGILAIGLLAG
jgi:hypothetical protein